MAIFPLARSLERGGAALRLGLISLRYLVFLALLTEQFSVLCNSAIWQIPPGENPSPVSIKVDEVTRTARGARASQPAIAIALKVSIPTAGNANARQTSRVNKCTRTDTRQ